MILRVLKYKNSFSLLKIEQTAIGNFLFSTNLFEISRLFYYGAWFATPFYSLKLSR